MDETQESTAASAAATRKRRSSILKSQRPPRTPFCELEFNVCTPTDTTKSRRVSFSRRTGVAEFATNEATTTWKNFYEEHNKSLESSGNDSGGNATKQTIGHLGKRIFDQQFEEVEAVDLFAGPVPALNISTTINTVNFTLECTDKLTAPQNNLELSALAEQRSKVFGDDLTVPCLGEVTDRIDVDFSAIQHIGEKDDLDEIQQDVQRQSQASCHGSFNGRRSLSEYVEVDLNTTYFGMQQQDQSDMSITDIVQSPKVQDVSKSVSIDKKVKFCQDWATDKENIAFNPYVAPRESLNFAINEESDKVLVFDGKKLIVQTEKSKMDHTNSDNQAQKIPQRKTINLNRSDDDLPNFDDIAPVADILGGSKLESMKISDILSNRDELHKSRAKHSTILYDDDLCDVSITNVVSGVPNNFDPISRTVVYEDNCNLSMTQAVPAKVIESDRNAILYKNCSDDISITDIVPINVVAKQNKEKTIIYEDHACEISMTQALPPNIISENIINKRKTIIYEECAGNVSITQAIPNIVIQEGASQDNRRSVIYENTASNISITKVIPTKIIFNEDVVLPERRKTVVFDSEDGNMSATQAIPTNIILPQKVKLEDVNTKNINKAKSEGLPSNPITEPNEHKNITDDLTSLQNNKETNKRRTVVFANEDADISMTQGVNLNQLLPGLLNQEDKEEFTRNIFSRDDAAVAKRQTILCEGKDADISVTQAVPNLLLELKKGYDTGLNSNDKRRTVVFDNDNADISITQAVNMNRVLSGSHLPSLKKEEYTNSASANDVTVNKRRTIVYEKDDADISMTQAIPNNLMLTKEEKRKTIVFDDMNMSTTRVVPAHIIAENQHLFMEIDKITNNDLQEYKPTVASKYNVDVLDISMTDLSVAEQQLPRSENNEKSILKVMSRNATVVHDTHDAIILDETTCVTKSKPIPGKISMLRDELNKSLVENIKLTQDSFISNVVSDIVVYQAVAVNSQNQPTSETDERDCPTQERVSEKAQDSSTKLSHDSLPVPNSNQIHYEMETSHNEGFTREEPNELIDEPKLSITSVKLNDSANQMRTVNKKSILHELLDMSDSSVVGVSPDNNVIAGTDEKNVTIKTESKQSVPSTDKPATANTSNDTLFYITRDSDDENNELYAKELSKTSDTSPLKYKLEIKSEIVADLQSEPTELNSSIKVDETSNQNYEKACSPDIEKQELLNRSKNSSFTQGTKSFKLANDTNELLDMLSDFTDKRKSVKNLPHLEEDEEKPEPILVKGHLALENKCDTPKPLSRKLGCIPKRQSIVLSREDLLNNISMAAAVLQKSRYELESDNSMEETDINTDSPETYTDLEKSIRVSNDVVKTLHFDEDSASDGNISCEAKSPLKKTAFGEVSYMKDTKAKVIPEYLKDVSDGVKDLMDDLVKPMADVLPFESVGVNSLKKPPSTCSTQIQANLVTSSQIDINTGLYSNPESLYEMNKVSSNDIINDAVNKSLAKTLKSPIKSNIVSPHLHQSMKIDDQKMPIRKVRYSNPYEVETQEPIIIFDEDNPLNNVVIAAPVNIEVHKYNPEPSIEAFKNVNPNMSANEIDRGCETVRVSAQYHVQSNFKLCGDDKSDIYSVTSKISRPVSIDQSTDAMKNDVMDTEVNTVIAMKANNELLEASSSLTLVDDAPPRTINIHTDSTTSDTEKMVQERPHSPVKVIYEIDENSPMNLDSDFTSNDELAETRVKSKKRLYSPTKRENRANLSASEVTPKPASKMQKLSRSPESNTEQPETLNIGSESESKERIQVERKSPKKSRLRKPGTSVTVQQLMAEYNVISIDEDGLRSKIKEVLANPESDSCSLDTASGTVVSSCSSKNMRNDSIVSQSTSNSSRMEWQADIDDDDSKSLEGCDSGVNIVMKIDMLPFMGSPECSWECSAGDTWSFLVLHARLRLTVTLAHRHHNSARRAVRADTGVARLALHTLRREERNPIVSLCVEYAARAIRWSLSRAGAARARGVPALVSRAAAAARLAARWARALARLAARTACTVTTDGLITLKVANIPLRSVWQVTAQLEAGGGERAPYPRAANVRVTSVLAAAPPPDLERLLANTPEDWGHAPNTIWKVFKYLKNKTRNDEISIGV